MCADSTSAAEAPSSPSPRQQRLKRFQAAFHEFSEAMAALESTDTPPDVWYAFGGDLRTVAVSIQVDAVARGATPPEPDEDDDDEGSW